MLAGGPLLGDELDCCTGKTPQPLGVTVGSGEEDRAEKGRTQCQDHKN